MILSDQAIGEMQVLYGRVPQILEFLAPSDEREDSLSLEQHIRQLEEKLLNPVHSQLKSVEILLADDFLEIGASGRIYDKKKVLQEFLVKPSAHYSIMDFSMRLLTRDVVLVTYRTMKQEPSQNPPVHSLRSSIWKHIDNRWQMIFHQGTLTNGTCLNI